MRVHITFVHLDGSLMLANGWTNVSTFSEQDYCRSLPDQVRVSEDITAARWPHGRMSLINMSRPGGAGADLYAGQCLEVQLHSPPTEEGKRTAWLLKPQQHGVWVAAYAGPGQPHGARDAIYIQLNFPPRVGSWVEASPPPVASSAHLNLLAPRSQQQ